MTVFEAYITNLGKYAEGQLVGETLKFPATTEEVQSLLKNIGVDGVRYEEFFITAFDGDVMGLYDTMKAYFYCRVAHDDSFSLERQAEELRRYAKQAGYTIVGAAAEHGSGMTLDRPALQEVMEAVLAGKMDVVLISSLDRIGRDWGMTKQYIALLTEHKVKLLCLRERVSSDISGVSPFST